MRKNLREVLTAWQAGKSLQRPSCSTDGIRIFSYKTCIVEREADGRVLLNETTYSVTTTAQQHSLMVAIPYALPVDDVPRGASSLGQYLSLREQAPGTVGYPEGTEFTSDPGAAK